MNESLEFIVIYLSTLIFFVLLILFYECSTCFKISIYRLRKRHCVIVLPELPEAVTTSNHITEYCTAVPDAIIVGPG